MNFSWQEFLELDLNQNIQIITPNQRLAKFINRQYQKTTNTKKLAFKADKVISLEQYLLKQFHTLQLRYPDKYAKFQLLNQNQEYHLWKNIIECSPYADSLLFKTLGLSKIISANQNCILWNIDLKNQKILHHHGMDQDVFTIWKEEFDRLCTEHSFLINANLFQLVEDSLNKGILDISEQYYLYGFDEITPAQQSLFNSISANSKLTNIGLPEKSCQTQKSVALQDFEDELNTAALWAKLMAQSSPDKKIAIVIPTLNENRSFINSTFARILNPESLNLFYHNDKSFNLSSGAPLSEMPLVKSALSLLKFISSFSQNEKIETHELLNVINDPILFQNDIPLDLRISLSEKIRKNNFSRIKPAQLWQKLSAYKNLDASKLVSSLHVLQEKSANGNLKKKMSYTQWQHEFIDFLESFHWLEGQTLSSESYQCCQKFKVALLELCLLDACNSNKVSIIDAVSSLKMICQQTSFQPESTNEEENQVSILGVLEAAAQDFDYIWLCQMNDHIWPAPAKPNPYLSISLQKVFDMPHSSADKEIRFSKQMIERFSHHCEHLILSFSMQDGDSLLNPSNLIKNIASTDKPTLFSQIQNSIENPVLKIEKAIKATSKMEFFKDDTLIPVDGNKIQGGQGLIKSQASCPFQAFATYRLNITSMEPLPDGINAMDRGNILHHLMELFWNKVKDHQTLLGYSHEQLSALLENLSSETGKEFESLKLHAPKAFEIELKRATKIAMAFVEAEKERPPFKVIACEEKKSITLNELELNLRIDRKDQLEDGSILIIDYKSGKPSTSGWIPPRMEEPQLPLYLYDDVETQAISFATLSLIPSEMGFQGLASKSGIAKGIDDCHDENKKKNRFFTGDWNDFVTQWKQDIETQVTDFKEGNNKPDPKSNASCTYCSFSSMCRIQEINHS